MKTKLMRTVIGLLAAIACLQFHNSLRAQSCAAVTNGLVSWWKANHNAMDSVGGNHGRAMEGVGYAEGRVGRAFSFRGDRYIEIPHSESLSFSPTTPMSIEFWAYRTSADEPQHILGKRVNCGDYNFNYLLYYHQDAVAWGPVSATGSLPLNIWTHLAAVFDGATYQLFVNGQLAGSAPGTLLPTNTTSLLLGGSGSCDGYQGLLDEVAMYNRALSAAEVAAIFTAGSAGKCGGLTFGVYDPPQWAIRQEGGRVRFSMSGRPGDRYVVESATELFSCYMHDNGEDPPYLVCYPPTVWNPHWLLFQDGSAPASVLSSPADGARFFRGRLTTRYYASRSPQVLFDREFPFGLYGSSIAGRWLFTNETPGLEPIIRLRTPGAIDSVANPLAAITGTLPANGPVFHLNPNTAQWAAAFSVFTTFNGTGQSFSNLPYGGQIYDAPLPPPRRAGQYAVDFMLRNPVTDNYETFASESFLYTTTPLMFLRLNRPIAGSNDFLSATVELSPGANPAANPVRLAAWLRTPSGEELSLPTLTPGFSLLFDGPAQATNFTVFSRSVVGFAQGNYRFEVRMYNATNGSLLAIASAPWMLCDGGQGSISGAVYSDGGQPLGAGAALAVVRAYDLDDGGETTSAAIGSDGHFAMTLEAGRYHLSAVVHDATGFHDLTNFVPLTILCGTTNLSLSLTTAPAFGPPALLQAQPAARKNGPGSPSPQLRAASDRLPAPRVLIIPQNSSGETLLGADLSRLQRELVGHFADELERINPEVVFITLLYIQQENEALANLQRLGTDTAEDVERVGALLAADFLMPLKFTEGSAGMGDSLGATMIVVCDITSFAPAQRQLPPGAGFDYAEVSTFATTCSQEFGGFTGLRARQCHPIQPHLTLTLNPEEIRINQTLTATATLREPDVNGVAVPGETITFRHSSVNGVGATTAVTDANGVATFTLPPQALPTERGRVTASYFWERREQRLEETKQFRVIGNSALTLSSPNAQVLSGGQAAIGLRLIEATLPGPGVPRPNALVVAQANNATITSTSGNNAPDGSLEVTTGANGDAVIDFTGGMSGGLATVQASFTDPGNGQIITASLLMNIETGVTTALSATPASILVGSRSIVTLDTLVSGARVASLPVEFTLSGSGSLSIANTGTDSAGQAGTRYSPPASGEGSATVTSIVTILGQRYTNATDISYTDIPCTTTTSYNNATDWSFTTNAPGQWRYGWVSGEWTPNDWPAITLYTSRMAASDPGNHIPGVDFWHDESSNTRNVLEYNSGGEIPHGDGATIHAGQKMHLHPGFDGIRAVLRWVAPCSGSLTVGASFHRRVLADAGDGVEVFVFHRDQHVHYALIPGTAAIGTASAFNHAFNVAAGDTVDFMVGPGPSNNEGHDTTQLDVSITLNPAP